MLSDSSGGHWARVSPLEVLVSRACDPSLPEPNYALHIEVADHINQKKANTPREAALLLAKLANHRNPHISILALSLLDTLVQSCGYPFHLQISTKEFLNELVRRFPERPPPFPGPVMSRILELINNWKEGICVESRWKEDLGNIRDMHRLLIYKGYRFRSDPRLSRRAVDSQLEAANLKSADELESEDRDAQSAKLQELIRRGTPRDLAAAQELMKSLAGAVPERKPDYRSQVLNDLHKLEQKVILLNEMLDNIDPSKNEKLVTGDVYDQVSTILIAARPKIQKWIGDAQEGSDDSESLDTLLQMNDQMNTVLTRYEAFKRGDYTSATNPVPSQYQNNGSNNNNGVSLIDFEDSPSSNTNGQGSSAPINDLDGLFGSSSVGAPNQQAASGNFNMNFPAQTQQVNFPTFAPAPVSTSASVSAVPPAATNVAIQPQPTQPHASAGYGMAMLLGESSSFVRPSSTGSSAGTPQGSIALPGTPTPSANLSKPPTQSTPNYFSSPHQQQPNLTPMGGLMGNNTNLGGGGMAGGPHTMGTASMSHSPPQPQQAQQQNSGKGNDPFGDLAGLF